MSFLSVQPQKQMSKEKEKEGASQRKGGGGLLQHTGSEEAEYSPFSCLTPPLKVLKKAGLLPRCLCTQAAALHAQSIKLSNFLTDPIRAHVSESAAGPLLEPPPPAPLPID